jgi:hypothetical protein
MTPANSDEARKTFLYFSNEYAQALQAFAAIETQAATLKVMGYNGELETFIDQFLQMATRVRSEALEQGEANFAEWFDELVKKAEALRGVGAR